jgi:hypothetical protein
VTCQWGPGISRQPIFHPGIERSRPSTKASCDSGSHAFREILAIPIDSTDANYAASLRSINAAVSTFLTFIAKGSDEFLRSPKQDALPKLLANIKEEEKRMEGEEKRLWAAELPELARELIKLSNEQVEELLAKRREHLKWRERSKTDLENKAAQSAKRRKPGCDQTG